MPHIFKDPALVPKLDPCLYDLQGDRLEFFKEQTGIFDDEALKRHIVDVQSKAYKVFGYPCIRTFAFTTMKISHLPAYTEVLRLLDQREDPILLDIGCCFGNDVRKAVVDGWPVQNVIASDLHQGFWDYGHELFRTAPDMFPAAFIAGDALNPKFIAPRGPILVQEEICGVNKRQRPPFKGLTSFIPLQGKISAIHASSFFHLFSEAQQLQLARGLAGLLVPEKGSVIFGSHIVMHQKGTRTETTAAGEWTMFCHSPETWKRMWIKDVFGQDDNGENRVNVATSMIVFERRDWELDRAGEVHEQCWKMNWCVTTL